MARGSKVFRPADVGEQPSNYPEPFRRDSESAMLGASAIMQGSRIMALILFGFARWSVVGATHAFQAGRVRLRA